MASILLMLLAAAGVGAALQVILDRQSAYDRIVLRNEPSVWQSLTGRFFKAEQLAITLHSYDELDFLVGGQGKKVNSLRSMTFLVPIKHLVLHRYNGSGDKTKLPLDLVYRDGVIQAAGAEDADPDRGEFRLSVTLRSSYAPVVPQLQENPFLLANDGQLWAPDGTRSCARNHTKCLRDLFATIPRGSGIEGHYLLASGFDGPVYTLHYARTPSQDGLLLSTDHVLVPRSDIFPPSYFIDCKPVILDSIPSRICHSHGLYKDQFPLTVTIPQDRLGKSRAIRVAVERWLDRHLVKSSQR